jgi:hypothetical protein
MISIGAEMNNSIPWTVLGSGCSITINYKGIYTVLLYTRFNTRATSTASTPSYDCNLPA